MSEPGTTTVQVEHWLNRLRDGDDAARNLLFQQASRRLEKLAEYMLRGYPGVGRWEQSEDVLQNALLRLNRALSEQTPESVRHFFNLAALAIRRELLDLAKHYQGPLGQGTNHDTVGSKSDCDNGFDNLPDSAESSEPASLEQWTRFHQEVELLPDEEREVFNLLWYDDLTQSEAALILGISERTVARRWSSARLRIHATLMQ
jgi:RNA polymerase sigma factor (sigma-70 family)